MMMYACQCVLTYLCQARLSAPCDTPCVLVCTPPQDVVEVMAPTYTMGLHDVDTSTKWTTSDVMCYFVSGPACIQAHRLPAFTVAVLCCMSMFLNWKPGALLLHLVTALLPATSLAWQ